MAKKDPRVDAYIDRSAEFARPILKHLRKVVHTGCPGVEETLKWGFPHFDYKGMMCSMAAFKHHCAFGFWKWSLIRGKSAGGARLVESAMGQFGRITRRADLPGEQTLLRLVKKAAALNEQGVKLPPRARPKANRKLEVPEFLLRALRKNRRALATFEGFSYSHRKDYVEWLTEARTEDTRKRRLETAVGWMAQGKARNWKYAKK